MGLLCGEGVFVNMSTWRLLFVVSGEGGSGLLGCVWRGDDGGQEVGDLLDIRKVARPAFGYRRVRLCSGFGALRTWFRWLI